LEFKNLTVEDQLKLCAGLMGDFLTTGFNLSLPFPLPCIWEKERFGLRRLIESFGDF
jgi:hypothetical protein